MIHWNEPPLRDVREILLRDFNTGKNIFSGDIANVVPRAQKSAEEKSLRSVAEVFTPPEVVKFMVDAADDENIFWQARVESRWLEAACGEAPFITTRYNAESDEDIPAARRVGILDRKLRAIPADISDKFHWATRAVQSVYGYELQGDSLLIARANVLLTFVEFVGEMSADELKEVAEIVAKNFWLMDGLDVPDAQVSLFGTHEIKITDWRTGKEIFFTGGHAMKFDFLISNPPYQDDTAGGNKNFASPIYHHFLREAPKVAEKSVLITPARFLFDAGATPKKFNRDMLNDPHFKVLRYEPDAKKVFRNVDIEGGVVVTLRDATKTFGAIGTFIPWDELRSVCDKVVTRQDFEPLSKIVFGRTKYFLTEKFIADHPAASCIDRANDFFKSNVFTYAANYFFDDMPDDGQNYCQALGLLSNGERALKYIRRDYIAISDNNLNFDKYKVFVPEANGASGKLSVDEAARIISKPVVGEPNVGCTQTFITVGAFDTRDEADACLKFIKSKFARAMLGIMKVTQHNPPDKWAKVPLQDFSAASDIDWRGDVDGQLYRKYGLSDAEIAFIESHVKEMP